MIEEGAMTNPVVWFEIYVQDLERATAFYEAVLEMKLEPMDSPVEGLRMMGFPANMEASGAAGALVQMEDFPEGQGNRVLVYLGCEDCGAAASRVKTAGGDVEKEKLSIGPYGFIALIRDTEGNMVGLHSMT